MRSSRLDGVHDHEARASERSERDVLAVDRDGRSRRRPRAALVAAAGIPALAAALARGSRGGRLAGRQAWRSGASAGRAATAPPRVDPGAAAREVLEDDDFWWKRIERVR